jgi:hypothetical protein
MTEVRFNSKTKEFYDEFYRILYMIDPINLEKASHKAQRRDEIIDILDFKDLKSLESLKEENYDLLNIYYLSSNRMKRNRDILNVLKEFFDFNNTGLSIIKRYTSIIRYTSILDALYLLEKTLQHGYLITQQLYFFISLAEIISRSILKKNINFFMTLDNIRFIKNIIKEIKIKNKYKNVRIQI